MDPLIKEYRTKHKKCKWCKYFKYNYAPCQLTYDWYTCELKDKIIHFENLPRLCKYYRLKEKELVVPTEEYKEMIQNSKIFIGGKEDERNK